MWAWIAFGYLAYFAGVTVGAATVGIGALVWRKFGKVVAQ